MFQGDVSAGVGVSVGGAAHLPPNDSTIALALAPAGAGAGPDVGVASAPSAVGVRVDVADV